MDLKNLSAKWKWIIGIVAVIVVLLIFGHVRQNGGTIAAAKNVSFVKQAKGSGTHVWFMSTGKAKKSDVYYIIVLKNGKARTYRTYDDDTNLGKLSKMSDHQAIAYAKQQDRKYFDASLKEAKLNHKGKVDHQYPADDYTGFNNDFAGLSVTSLPDFKFLASANNDSQQKLVGTVLDTGDYDDDDNPYMVAFNNDGKLLTSIDGSTKLPKGTQIADQTPKAIPMSTDKASENNVILDRFYKALYRRIDNTSYAAPKPMKVKVKSKTDDSGNDIVSQKATVQYTQNFDEYQLKYNFIDLAGHDPAIMRQLGQAAEKIVKAQENYNDDGSAPEDKASAEYAQVASRIFTDKVCYKLTKDMFTNEQIKYTMTLKEPASFDIYKSHFIGYNCGAKNGYLVTKAQNDNQTAVFAK
ncbi:hypothetical protein [[Lactobacillus] timonensis]|uniref:hypothetical protein n=1 Tax=[Lactobacillus] timonensis TaxID=1970790 RepID=UPI000C8398BC|nr:hypothetical protein [[Lactobacillus] timonensis]